MAEMFLKNGAEIARVEETIYRLADHFQIEEIQCYVVTNGVFLNYFNGGHNTGTILKDIRYVNVDLYKLSAINELSRELTSGQIDEESALSRLYEIEQTRYDPAWRTVLAAGVGGAAFSYMLDASLTDCMTAFICGIVVQGLGSFLEYKCIHISKSVATIAGSLLCTLLCVFFMWLGFSDHLDLSVIGAIIPMIPGVALINGVRDLVDGNYLSGFVRLSDAFLIFFCLATGVGLGLKL